jgi:hypothetical protein
MDNSSSNGQFDGVSGGALSLLRNCVGAVEGDRLLIVEEAADAGYYDPMAPALAASAGRAMGLHVYEMQAPPGINSADDMTIFLNSLRGFDHVLFFARIGDQIRFNSVENLPPATMCYTLDGSNLNSDFATACHHGLCEFKEAIDTVFASAREVTVTCPLGTDYRATFAASRKKTDDVSIKRFPTLVPRPVAAQGYQGEIVLSRFLTGTGSRFYEPYCLPLEDNVVARVRDNTITGFDGNADTVASVQRHYEYVASLYSLDAMYVHSWHAGMHPACEFNADATADLVRWSGCSFGSPRILHFHTCGSYAPGEISWNILDPTITVDGVTLWEDGTLHPERLPDGELLCARHPELSSLYQQPKRHIGLDTAVLF